MQELRVEPNDERQPLVARAQVKTQRCCAGFLTFLHDRGNIVQLAVAFILGVSLQTVVTSLVNDILLPPIGLLGGNNFQNLFWVMRHGATLNETYSTINQAAHDGAVTENYGRFLQSCINFVVIAFLMYLVVLAFDSVVKHFQAQAAATAAATTKKCSYCRKDIDLAATRCPFCTSQLDSELSAPIN